jgi:hypothetical protein
MKKENNAMKNRIKGKGDEERSEKYDRSSKKEQK